MKVTISVFFSGTGHEMSDNQTLAYLLHGHIETNQEQIKLGFDGCGVTHGFRGTIFGAGLDEQCQEAIGHIEAEIKKGNTVTLNVYGHSRGAIGALMLAKQLSAVDKSLLEINLALLDPVPGNFITTSTLDQFDISLAKKTMDLRECKPLKNVLALYPHQPLPTLAVHAPLFSLYPEHTQVEEEVIAGCHAGAQFQDVIGDKGITSIHFQRDSFITFARIFTFMRDCGTIFKPLPSFKVRGALINASSTLDSALKLVYEYENRVLHEKNYRDCHSAIDVSINTKEKAEYFNLHHQRLSGVPEDKRRARVTIEENQGPVSQLKRATLHYPRIWQAVKWTLISLSLTSLLLITSGLSALALIMGLSAKFVMLSFSAAVPVVGGVTAGFWYGAIKPLSQWAINRFFYPMYHARDIHPDHSIDKPITGSPQALVKGLRATLDSNASLVLPEDDAVHTRLFNGPARVVDSSLGLDVDSQAPSITP